MCGNNLLWIWKGWVAAGTEPSEPSAGRPAVTRSNSGWRRRLTAPCRGGQQTTRPLNYNGKSGLPLRPKSFRINDGVRRSMKWSGFNSLVKGRRRRRRFRLVQMGQEEAWYQPVGGISKTLTRRAPFGGGGIVGKAEVFYCHNLFQQQ